MPSYELKVVTPQGTVFTGEVRHARIPVENGCVGVLANHAPFVTSSSGGTLEIEDQNGHVKNFEVGSGFFTVENNHASFLTDKFINEDDNSPKEV